MSVRKLARIAIFAAVLFVVQVTLSFIPNCELVSLLLICMTLIYGKEMIITSLVFAGLETMVYGIGTWTLMYLYVWPVLVLAVLLLKPIVKSNFTVWAVVAGIYGLSFGFLCTLIYIPLGWNYCLAYFIKGLQFDVIHGASNFIITLTLGKTVYTALNRVSKISKKD